MLDKIKAAKKRSVRKQLSTHNNCPVVFIKNSKKKPELKGSSYYFTNKSGDIIRYPSAYSRAFGKPIYHNSTLRIEVGENYKFKLSDKIKRLLNIIVFV